MPGKTRRERLFPTRFCLREGEPLLRLLRGELFRIREGLRREPVGIPTHRTLPRQVALRLQRTCKSLLRCTQIVAQMLDRLVPVKRMIRQLRTPANALKELIQIAHEATAFLHHLIHPFHFQQVDIP